MFSWLYYLKDEVNKRGVVPPRPSITFHELTERYVFHGAVVDDVELGDVLVLFAIGATVLKKEPLFVELCDLLVSLLPLPHDSELVRHLVCVDERSVVAHTVRAARAARIERGLTPLTAAHYKALVD